MLKQYSALIFFLLIIRTSPLFKPFENNPKKMCKKKKKKAKPFVICTVNGYIVDVLGPFAATKNYDNIFSLILKKGC